MTAPVARGAAGGTDCRIYVLQSSMVHYVLYYAKCCKYSKDLCEQLYNQPALVKRFRFVDAGRLRQVSMVPTIVADDKSYVGRDAFLWLRQACRQGPGCWDVNDVSGIEYSNLEGLDTGYGAHSQQYCPLVSTGASTIAASAQSQHAQAMDPRVAELMRARAL